MLIKVENPLPGLYTHPNLSERDARLLTEKIVQELFQMGMPASEFGVVLKPEGFQFAAEIAGRRVWVSTGQGNFSYRQVAAELIAAALKQAESPVPAGMMTTV